MSDLFCGTGYVKFRLWETQVMGDTGYGRYRLWEIQVMGDMSYQIVFTSSVCLCVDTFK